MAPRGRHRRMGTSRMDAAIDAMTPFGFPKDLVRAKMNGLLKVYGGEEGYPFIEADAYKVLIDALLAGEEEEDKQADNESINCAEGETSMKDDSPGNGVADHTALTTAGPSVGSNESVGSETPNTLLLTIARAEGDGNSWKDIVLDHTCSQDERMGEAADNIGGFPEGDGRLHDPPLCSRPPSITSSPSPQSTSPKRRRPCYGWISDREEEDIFVILTPAVIAHPWPSTLETCSNVTVKQTKRKTRWDIRPEDV